MLEVKHLAVSYHDVKAVEDVSFAIASGQMVAVIGPNGAGKSTIFKAILGLVPASNGHGAMLAKTRKNMKFLNVQIFYASFAMTFVTAFGLMH